MATPTEMKRLLARMGVEVRKPSLFHGLSLYGVPIEPFRDPVLTTLAEFPDQREYESMWRLAEVYDPWRHMTAAIFAAPFEIQAGRSTPAAAVLRARAQHLWHGLPPGDRHIVLQRLLDAEWFGWRPMQLLLEQRTWPGLGSNSREAVWVPRRILDKPPEHFRFTPEADRRLVFVPGFGRPPVLFSPEEMRAGWMLPRVRTLDDPYGTGLAMYAWMVWRATMVMVRKFFKSVDREWGMVKVSKPPSGRPAQEEIRAIQDDVAEMLRYFNQNNVLLELQGFTVDFVERLEFISSGVELLRHLRTTIQTLIEGQTLTSDTSTAGPAGSSQVHQEVRSEFAKAAIATTVECSMEEMFRNSFWLNLGEVDPEDCPRFVSWLKLRLNVPTVKLLYEMGLPMRGKRVAELLNAGSVVDRVEVIESEGDEALVRKEGVSFGEALKGMGFGSENDAERGESDV